MESASKTSTDVSSRNFDSPGPFSLGIDVRKTDLELALLDEEEQLTRKSVPNDEKGHEALQEWLQAQRATPEATRVCTEASGGFEREVATHLHEAGYLVSVVNPRRISGYANSQLQRTKTDPADAALIARFGKREETVGAAYRRPEPIAGAYAGEAGLQKTRT